MASQLSRSSTPVEEYFSSPPYSSLCTTDSSYTTVFSEIIDQMRTFLEIWEERQPFEWKKHFFELSPKDKKELLIPTTACEKQYPLQNTFFLFIAELQKTFPLKLSCESSGNFLYQLAENQLSEPELICALERLKEKESLQRFLLFTLTDKKFRSFFSHIATTGNQDIIALFLTHYRSHLLTQEDIFISLKSLVENKYKQIDKVLSHKNLLGRLDGTQLGSLLVAASEIGFLPFLQSFSQHRNWHAVSSTTYSLALRSSVNEGHREVINFLFSHKREKDTLTKDLYQSILHALQTKDNTIASTLLRQKKEIALFSEEQQTQILRSVVSSGPIIRKIFT